MMFNYLFNEKILSGYFREQRRQNANKDEFNVTIRRKRFSDIQEFKTNFYYPKDVEEFRKQEEDSSKRPIGSYSLGELFTGFIKYYTT